MRAAILSGANKDQHEILYATYQGRSALAKYYDWTHYTATDSDYSDDTHPSWQKIDLIKRLLPQYDAILWLDADSFVTNPKACPMPAQTAFTISTDWCAPDDQGQRPWISCGNFWIVNKPESFEFFKVMEKFKPHYAYRETCCWEQDAFHQVLWRSSKLRQEVTILPRTAMNSVMCEKEGIQTRYKYQKGDFLCHLTNVDDRMMYIDQLKNDLRSNQ